MDSDLFTVATSGFSVYTGMADLSDTSHWWFNCVCVSESVCLRTCRQSARRMMNG